MLLILKTIHYIKPFPFNSIVLHNKIAITLTTPSPTTKTATTTTKQYATTTTIHDCNCNGDNSCNSNSICCSNSAFLQSLHRLLWCRRRCLWCALLSAGTRPTRRNGGGRRASTTHSPTSGTAYPTYRPTPNCRKSKRFDWPHPTLVTWWPCWTAMTRTRTVSKPTCPRTRPSGRRRCHTCRSSTRPHNSRFVHHYKRHYRVNFWCTKIDMMYK